MKHKCLYCGRMRKSLDEPCPGCGQTEIAEVSERRESEFFHKGYFVKVIREWHDREYFFFRGDKLVDRIKIGIRDWMVLIEPLEEGTDCFYLIWEMFKKSQKEKFGVVKTYEDDPKYKRIEVRLVPWGYETCNAFMKVNGNLRTLCNVHGGNAHANWQGLNRVLGGVPQQSGYGNETLKKLIRKSVGLDG